MSGYTLTSEAMSQAQVWEMIHTHGMDVLAIAPMDFCPACSGGFVADEDGFPVIGPDGMPVECSLCDGRGLLVEHCPCGCDEEPDD